MKQPTKEQLKLLVNYLSQAEDTVYETNRKVDKDTHATISDVVALCLLYIKKSNNFTFSSLPEKAQTKLMQLLSDYRKSIYDNIYWGSVKAYQLSSLLQKELGYVVQDTDVEEVDKYINQSYDNRTLKDRISITTSNMASEWEEFLAVSLLSGGKKVQDIVNDIWVNKKAPFAALPMTGSTDLKSVRLAKEFHPGKGFSKSGLSQLKKMSEMAVIGMYHEGNYLEWGKMGAVGYRTRVTSTNPCSVCVDSEKVVHKDNPLPYHPNCKCIAYMVFKENDKKTKQ